MGQDKEKEFKEVESMTKDEAITEIKKFFKGNKKFIEHALVLIYSTHGFVKLNSIKISTDNWNWEKFLSITIDSKLGFKQLYYRKGNKKYASPKIIEGNKTHDIDEYVLTIYYTGVNETERYTF